MADEKRIESEERPGSLGFGLGEAIQLTEAEADIDQATAAGVGGYEPGQIEGTSAVGTGMADKASKLTDVDTSRAVPDTGNTGSWRSDNPAGTKAGAFEAGTGDGGWERDNDAHQIDVNPGDIRHVNTADANEGSSFAEADGPDRTPEEE